MLQSCQNSVQCFGKWQWRDSLTILSYYQFNADEFAIGITDVLFQGLLGELCPSAAGSSSIKASPFSHTKLRLRSNADCLQLLKG